MFEKHDHGKPCVALESKLVQYLDGRAQPADRHAVERHLSECAACRTRADEFRALWSVLDDLPAITPSAAFDSSLRARIAAESVRRRFWDWMPSPRLAFAVTALVAMSVWMSSTRRVIPNPSVAGPATLESNVAVESDLGIIRDLPVLENYDVVSKFDALSELSGPAAEPSQAGAQETR